MIAHSEKEIQIKVQKIRLLIETRLSYTIFFYFILLVIGYDYPLRRT